jgi:hypothetical protein
MNRQIVQSFLTLRVSERQSIMRDLNINLAQGGHETNLQHATRVLQMIEKEGIMRNLEDAMRQFQ